jgi:hypothetical protein
LSVEVGTEKVKQWLPQKIVNANENRKGQSIPYNFERISNCQMYITMAKDDNPWLQIRMGGWKILVVVDIIILSSHR